MDLSEFNWAIIIPGIAIGLFGWMLYWTGLPLIGGVVGAGVGGMIGYLASGLVEVAWALNVFTAVGFLLGAVVGVFLIRTIQTYFFFASGAGLGGALCWNLIEQGPFQNLADSSPGWGVALVVIVGALAGGLLVLRYRRFIIAVVTSVIGMLMVTPAIPERYQFIGSLVALAFFLAVQCGLVRRFVDREAFDRRTARRIREDIPRVETAD